MGFDIIIENAMIYDGTGRIPYSNDVGLRGNRIAAIGKLSQADATERIDAKGLALSPGFVDVHTHAEMAIQQDQYTQIVEPLVRQGITTIVGGNCGAGLAPISPTQGHLQHEFYEVFLGGSQEKNITWQSFGEMLSVFEKNGLVQNCAMLAPHGMIRSHAMGDARRTCHADELEIMKKTLSECMEQGAVGMSTGLMYFPGLSCDEKELQELGHVLSDYNGVFTSHLRSYNSDTLGDAIDEVLTVGQKAGIPVQISHLFWVPNFPSPLDVVSKKAIKAASWLYNKRPFPVPLDSSTKGHLKRIGRLVDQGYPIGIDAMPTSAGFTHLFAFLPPWSLEGGMKQILNRIGDPATRKKIRKSIENGKPVWPHREEDSWGMNLFQVMGWDCAFVMSVVSEKNQKWVGKSFVEIGKILGKHPFDAACDLALEENGKVLIFETATFPGDELVELSLLGTLLDRNVSIATDTIPSVFGKPSHLTYDAFPRFIGSYARDRKLISMHEAIRKCTSLPAKQLQLKNRGKIETGFFADLVLFDPHNIRSHASAQDPAHFAEGIKKVFVNGVLAADETGYYPDRRSGQVIRGSDN